MFTLILKEVDKGASSKMSPQNVRRNANHVYVDILTWHSNGHVHM